MGFQEAWPIEAATSRLKPVSALEFFVLIQNPPLPGDFLGNEYNKIEGGYVHAGRTFST